MNLPLLNHFLDLILDYRPCCEISNTAVLDCIKSTPEYEKCWHLQTTPTGAILWRKKDWIDSEHRKALAREQKLVEDGITQERKEAFFNLCKSIVSMLELGEYSEVMDNKHQRAFVYRMAEKFIKSKSATAEKFFGVNITTLPELPRQYMVLDERTGKKEYEL